MPDQEKTRAELLVEIAQLRRRVAALETGASPNGDGRLSRDGAPRELDTTAASRPLYAEMLLDAVPEAVYMADLEGRICYANRTFLTATALSEEDVIGKTLPETRVVESERFLALRRQVMPQVMAEGRVREVESHTLNRDGSKSAVLVDLTLVRGNAGQPSHIAAMARRVTGLQDAERALIQSERRYREIVETVADLIVTIDLNGTVCSVNYAVKTMLGLDPDWVIGRPLTDFVLEEYRADMVSQVERVLAGQNIRSETVLLDGANHLVHVEYSAGPLTEDGHVVGARGIAWDITKRKALERELKVSEERYRALVESAGEAIATISKDGTFQFMNSTAAQRLGGRPADFMGKTMWELFPAEVADRQMSSIREVIRTGEGSNTVSLTYVGGAMRWYNTTIQPLRDSDGRTTAGLVIARDIHDFKKAQDELAAYSERMIRAEQLASLGTLSATLSHELTQPLTVIRLSIQNSLEDLESTPCPQRVVEDLKDGLAEIASVTAIAERFRSFARRSSEKVVRDISIDDTARKVMALLNESARRANTIVEMRQLDTLPPVSMHEKDLEQLIFALAQNAIQAAPGDKVCHFAILGHREGDRIVLQFCDDCGGVAQENLDRIFEPFFTTKPAGEGTGLGLCIAQRVVSQARGEISVESKPGQGTSFFVSLPVQRA